MRKKAVFRRTGQKQERFNEAALFQVRKLGGSRCVCLGGLIQAVVGAVAEGRFF